MQRSKEVLSNGIAVDLILLLTILQIKLISVLFQTVIGDETNLIRENKIF